MHVWRLYRASLFSPPKSSAAQNPNPIKLSVDLMPIKKGSKSRNQNQFTKSAHLRLNQNPAMAEETQLRPQHISEPEHQLPHLPSTFEESVERGDGGGRRDKENPKDAAAPPSIWPPDVAVPSFSTPPLKKGHGRRKKNPLNAKQRAVAEQRLILLSENFHPVPFSPAKNFDLSSYEELFHALGLWDFAHLELDQTLRPDLLAHLIAFYDSSSRRSYVHDTRISVSRNCLARAIGLPATKDKGNAFEGRNSIQHLASVDETSTVLMDFMSNYMFFEDDMCILPSEIIQAIEFVKDGVPHQVDWAALMWILVEKELSDGPKSGTCYYASHLQRLIKHQHPHLFSKELEPAILHVPEPEGEEVSVSDEEANLAKDEVNAIGEDTLVEDEDDAGVTKMRSLDDLGNVASERHESEMGLMLTGDENVMNGFGDCKVGEEDQWLEEEKNECFGHCLQRCNSRASNGMDFENLTKMDEVEKGEERFTDDLPAKLSNLERLTSSNPLQAMENVNIPYGQQLNSLNPSSGEFLTMRADSLENIMLDHSPSGSIYFGNNGKRQIDDAGNEEEDQFDNHNKQKKMRSCEPWGNLALSFDECMDYIQCGMRGTKVLFAEKDQALVNMEIQLQCLNHLLQEKEQLIRSLKMMVDEQQNWQMAVRHYEHEICLVTQMMLGYKRALKETRSRFADYREKHPHDDESLSKDVSGMDGLVLSAREFENHRLGKKEEMFQEFLGTIGNLEKILGKFKESEECIMKKNKKLAELSGEMKQLKERNVESTL